MMILVNCIYELQSPSINMSINAPTLEPIYTITFDSLHITYEIKCYKS